MLRFPLLQVLDNRHLAHFQMLDSFWPETGCPKFYLSDLARLTVIVENGAKASSIVQKLKHRVMQLLCQWTSWFKSYSWKTFFTYHRDSVDPYFKTRIKCCHECVFHEKYKNQFVGSVGPSGMAGRVAYTVYQLNANAFWDREIEIERERKSQRARARFDCTYYWQISAIALKYSKAKFFQGTRNLLPW